jgi:predicted RNA-binding Zn-ribbon protein involved in translation (DUF1610 family)
MGTGYIFKCKNCRKKYSVFLGIGSLFPKVYRETLKDIDEGKYGEEWQRLYRETPYAAVDAESELFICDKCGNWNVSKNLSLYAPNEPQRIKEKQYGSKNEDKLGYVPYVMRFDLEQEYHLLKDYAHLCSKCGTVMKRADDVPFVLPCPKCGADNEMEPSLVMWD